MTFSARRRSQRPRRRDHAMSSLSSAAPKAGRHWVTRRLRPSAASAVASVIGAVAWLLDRVDALERALRPSLPYLSTYFFWAKLRNASRSGV